MKKLIEAAKRALTTPFRQQTVVDGFSFQLHWDSNRQWFECVMSYTPSWSGHQYLYGRTIDELIKDAESAIKDCKKIYTNGGRYPENYYNN